MRYRLSDITEIIRSKNSGPYELTLDLIFKDKELFEKVCASQVINEALVCSLYHLTPEQIINIVEFAPANAIKITIVRPIASGDIGERDVYGAQQHAPLLDLEFEM
jgi:hypothetical protein